MAWLIDFKCFQYKHDYTHIDYLEDRARIYVVFLMMLGMMVFLLTFLNELGIQGIV